MIAIAYGLLLLALASTIGLAWSVMPTNVPTDPYHRSIYVLTCHLWQVPRWLCLTSVLLICVRLGHAPWAGAAGPQYAAVVAAQLLIGVGCAVCLDVSYEGRRPFEIPSIVLRLVPFVVPIAVAVFAAWMLSAGPRASTPVTRGGWLVLATTGAAFVVVGVGSYLHDEARRAREAVGQLAFDRVAATDRVAADDARFRALTPADPLPAWLEFIGYDTPAATKAAAVAGIARRPTLADDIRAELATKDYLVEGRALSLFGRVPPGTCVGLIDVFREYGRTLVAEEQAAAAEPTFEKARDRFEFANARANAFADAGRALFAAGVDVRPELDAVAAVARGRDYDGARKTVETYDHDRTVFEKRVGASSSTSQ